MHRHLRTGDSRKPWECLSAFGEKRSGNHCTGSPCRSVLPTGGRPADACPRIHTETAILYRLPLWWWHRCLKWWSCRSLLPWKEPGLLWNRRCRWHTATDNDRDFLKCASRIAGSVFARSPIVRIPNLWRVSALECPQVNRAETGSGHIFCAISR